MQNSLLLQLNGLFFLCFFRWVSNKSSALDLFDRVDQ